MDEDELLREEGKPDEGSGRYRARQEDSLMMPSYST